MGKDGKAGGLEAHIGIEQEFFLVHRDPYLNRPDLQVSFRNVLPAFFLLTYTIFVDFPSSPVAV